MTPRPVVIAVQADPVSFTALFAPRFLVGTLLSKHPKLRLSWPDGHSTPLRGAARDESAWYVMS
jgi:hypothetical protein